MLTFESKYIFLKQTLNLRFTPKATARTIALVIYEN